MKNKKITLIISLTILTSAVYTKDYEIILLTTDVINKECTSTNLSKVN